jgi:hypothetical protein
MNRPTKKRRARQTASDRPDPTVTTVFDAYPKPLKSRLLALRRLILDTARTTEGVGKIEEALKWGQVSYLTRETKSGSTVRIDQVKCAANRAIIMRCISIARPIWSQPFASFIRN